MAAETTTDLNNGAEMAASKVKSAISETSATINNIVDMASSNLTSLVKNTGTTAMDFGSEATRSVEEALKAGGRVTLALGNLCNALFGGLSATLATGANILALGTNNIDSYLNDVPVIGVVTTGLNNLMSGMSSTVNHMTNTGRESRKELIMKLRSGLDQSYQTNKDATAATAATAAANTKAT